MSECLCARAPTPAVFMQVRLCIILHSSTPPSSSLNVVSLPHTEPVDMSPITTLSPLLQEISSPCSFRSPFICHSYVSTPACRVRTSFYCYRRLPAHLAGHSATKNISIQSATYKVCIKYHTCISPLVKDPSERADDRKGGSAPTWQHKSETLSPGGQ